MIIDHHQYYYNYFFLKTNLEAKFFSKWALPSFFSDAHIGGIWLESYTMWGLLRWRSTCTLVITDQWSRKSKLQPLIWFIKSCMSLFFLKSIMYVAFIHTLNWEDTPHVHTLTKFIAILQSAQYTEIITAHSIAVPFLLHLIILFITKMYKSLRNRCKII